MDEQEMMRIAFQALLGERVDIEDIRGSGTYETGKRLEAAFTSGVDFLRSTFPCPRINLLMGIVWDLVGNRVVPTAMGPVPTLSFTMVGHRRLQSAVILIPTDWVDRIAEDIQMQTGALVFVGSEAVDYYNGRFAVDPKRVIPRARAHEAEFLSTLQRIRPDWEPNDYQRQVLADYPRGLQSSAIRKHLYTPAPFVPAAGQA